MNISISNLTHPQKIVSISIRSIIRPLPLMLVSSPGVPGSLNGYDWTDEKCIMNCVLLIRILQFAGHLYLEVAVTLSTTINQHQPAQSLQHQLSLLRMSTTWQNFVALCPCFNDSIGKNIRPEIRSKTCVSSRHKLGNGFDNFSRQWML